MLCPNVISTNSTSTRELWPQPAPEAPTKTATALSVKAQLICASLIFLLTLADIIIGRLHIEFPRGSFLGSTFDFGMALMLLAPVFKIMNALGIAEKVSPLGWSIFEILINTLIGFLLGTVLGLLITLIQKLYRRIGGKDSTLPS